MKKVRETEVSVMTKGDQELLSGDSRMQENLLAAEVPPWTPLRELTVILDILAGGEGAGCPLHKNPIDTVDHSIKHVDEYLPALLEKSGNLMWSEKWPH